MKKIYILLTFSFSFFNMNAENNQAVRQAQINKCKSEFKDKMKGSNLTADDIQSFCECNADKLLSKFTADEIQKMDAIMATGNDQQKQVIAEKITPVIMPCFADLQTKMKK